MLVVLVVLSKGRLAVIQGRLSFTSPPQSRGRHLNNNRNGNCHHEDTRTTGTATGHVWRGRLDSHPRGNSNPNRQQNMNHHANTNRFNHPRGGHSRHRQVRDDNSVITGTSNNCSLCAAPPPPPPPPPPPEVVDVNRIEMDCLFHVYLGTLALLMW